MRTRFVFVCAPPHPTPTPPHPTLMCRSCITRRGYTRWYTFPELHDSCPVCRGICSCRACLREATRNSSGGLEVPGEEEQRAAAAYVLALGAPRLLEVLAAEEEEVRQEGIQWDISGQGASGGRSLGWCG
jgi:hypothetical protein